MSDLRREGAHIQNVERPSPMPDSPPPGRIRLLFLDGVRGLAALFVMAHHLWRSYTHVALPGINGFATNWLLYGHLAVDVFIVLSGFCLMLPVARSRVLRGGTQRFYLARCRRILPPMYAAIGLGIVVAYLHRILPTRSDYLADLFIVSDIWPSDLDGPLWSVALEWKIYFLFPAFTWLWLRYGARAVLWAAAGVSAIVFAAARPFLPADSHFAPWYVFLFGMGMVATDFAIAPIEDNKPSWRIPLLLAVALLGLGAALHEWPVTSAGETPLYVPHLPLIDCLTGAATAMLLLLLGRKAMRNEPSLMISLLSWKPFVFVGGIGYSLYLVHAILIYKVKNELIAHLHLDFPWVVIPIDMLLVIGLAYLFHLLFERPFMTKPAPRSEKAAELAAIVSPAP